MTCPKIKICGITNVEDALTAAQAGADALGFIFVAASPRAITPEQAAEIIHHLAPFIAKVGVFVNTPESQVRQIAADAGLDTLQFHGEETPEYCRQFRLPTIKAFRIHDADSLAPISHYPTSAWLLDSFKPGQLGGTGAVFNWRWALKARSLGRPIILAGGLTPDNVVEGIHQVQPYAVDVSSGVEQSPRRKDPAKVRDFIAAVKESRYDHDPVQ